MKVFKSIARRGITLWSITLLCLIPFSSCSEDKGPYPDIVTEFAEIQANDQGMAEVLTLDDGRSYGITNKIADLKPKAHYRVVCGYVAQQQQATIYNLEPAYVLRDSSDIACCDPTGILSAWMSKAYINLHLRPKTQGGIQHWGFITDSITTHHTHLSLHHCQNGDPTSYSRDVYASLPLDSLKGTANGDTITLSVKTFNGAQSFTFKR